jgi:hypothetical protein
MSEIRTAAGHELMADSEFHDKACPFWSSVGDAACTCPLPERIVKIEQQGAAAPNWYWLSTVAVVWWLIAFTAYVLISPP